MTAGEAAMANAGDVVESCRRETETLFIAGRYHCAEAVLAVIRRHFSPETPESIVQLMSGFGSGSGAGCICGALSAATVAFGLVLREDKAGTSQMTKTMHAWFKHTYGAACCRVLQDKEQGTCRVHPGEVAGKVAELLSARSLLAASSS